MASIIVNRILSNGSSQLSAQETNSNTGFLDVGPVTIVNGAPQTLDCPITVANLTLAYISTTVDDTTFNFDGTTPTLTIKANTPYLWTTDSNLVNALSGNFTNCVVTNPDADNDAVVNMWFNYTA